MALLWTAYERLGQRDPQRGHHRQLPLRGRRLGRLLYEVRWLDPQAVMLRESIQRWISSLVTGEVTLRLRRGEDYSILATCGPNLLYHPDKLSMERTTNPAFGPTDRIGQLTMRNLDIADSRSKWSSTRRSRSVDRVSRRARMTRRHATTLSLSRCGTSTRSRGRAADAARGLRLLLTP